VLAAFSPYLPDELVLATFGPYFALEEPVPPELVVAPSFVTVTVKSPSDVVRRRVPSSPPMSASVVLPSSDV